MISSEDRTNRKELDGPVEGDHVAAHYSDMNDGSMHEAVDISGNETVRARIQLSPPSQNLSERAIGYLILFMTFVG
jgi:hypothetical protein